MRSPLEGNFRLTASDRAALDSANGRIADSTGRSADRVRVIAPTSIDATDTTAQTSMERIVQKRAKRLAAMSETDLREYVLGSFARYLPNVLLGMVPLFAFFLWLLHRKSGRLYAEHLIFALHFHAFFFVAATLMTPESGSHRSGLYGLDLRLSVHRDKACIHRIPAAHRGKVPIAGAGMPDLPAVRDHGRAAAHIRPGELKNPSAVLSYL